MKNIKITFLMIILSICLVGCGESNAAQSSVVTVGENSIEPTIVMPTETPTPTPTIEVTPIIENQSYSLSMIAAGDNLIHSPIYQKARQEDGSYDFSPMYENIKPLISSYDLSIINQETIFVADEQDVSSYPCFGTPNDMGKYLLDCGFDVFLGATNHTMDKRVKGIENMLDYWDNVPNATLLGINRTEEDANEIDIIEQNGFKLAMFNYTYGLNGFTLPSDRPYLVNLLDNKEKFIEDVKSVEDEVDFTICFLHIGAEYVYEPTSYQKQYINDLIDSGADIIICAHPHVIEPYGMITTDAGNTALVYYSCGNFISGQNEVPRVLGGLADIRLKKDVVLQDGVIIEESVSIESFDFIPIVTHYNKTEHTIYKLEDYTEELAQTHSLRGKGLNLDKLWTLWNDVIENN